MRNVNDADFTKYYFSSQDTISYSLLTQMSFHKDQISYQLVFLFNV